MNPARLIRISKKIIAARFFDKRVPIGVGWSLSNQCNLNCAYCGFPGKKSTELSTDTVLLLLDEMAASGVELVSFTGGEPLLRKNIGEILQRARDLGLIVKLNTNGHLVPRHIHKLKACHSVQISLDGDAGIHDSVRGEGSYHAIMEALEALRSAGIYFDFLCTISSSNAHCIESVEKIATEWGTGASFQPAIPRTLGAGGKNPLVPQVQEYRNAIQVLLKLKQEGKSSILNSTRSLKHLLKWPEPAKIKCSAGRIACRIETDGKMVLCGREMPNTPSTDVTERGFLAAFESLVPSPCQYCWCASIVELNYLYSLLPDVSWHFLKRRIYGQVQ